MDELLSLKWKNHCPSFLELLGTLRQKQIYTDVTLACSGKFYSAHRLILTACSDYFRDIFEHLDCNKPVIVLKDINCDNLEALLDYMYVGEVSVKQSNLSSLIKAAECLHVKGLAVADDEPSPKTSKKQSFTPRFIRKRKVTDTNNDIPDSTKHFKYIKTDKDSIPKSQEQSNKDDNEIYFKEDAIYVKQEIEEQSETDSIGIDKKEEETFPDDKVSDTNYGASGSTSHLLDNAPTSHLLENAPTSPYQENTEWQDSDSSWNGSSNYDYGPVENVNNSSLSKQKNCIYCSKEFPSPSLLSRHMMIHTGEKPFVCKTCPYQANVKSNLKRHMRLKHQQIYNDS